jgi:MoxR-like ATPase
MCAVKIETPDQFDRFTGTERYIASRELRDAVNVAVSLERPLLIRGEPGTGKTLLAHSVASALDMPLFAWHVKSTTRAQDGLYVYDTVQRLNDSRFDDGADVGNIKNYIKLGPLGEAITSPERAVLLIDEIDKADLEFPNDLLREIDEMSFYIPETRETLIAEHRPVVIITSNAEKELPDAFLRRCVFHYIAFPEQAQMEEIVKVHYPDIDQEMLLQCMMKFYWLREQPEVRKKPSTSELIDWLGALRRAGLKLDQLQGKFPFLGVLLKKEADLTNIQKKLN